MTTKLTQHSQLSSGVSDNHFATSSVVSKLLLIQPNFHSVPLIYKPMPAQLTQHLPLSSKPSVPLQASASPNFPPAILTILYPRKAALLQPPPTPWEPATFRLDCPLACQPPDMNFRYSLVTDSPTTLQRGENMCVLIGFQNREEIEDDLFWKYIPILKNIYPWFLILVHCPN